MVKTEMPCGYCIVGVGERGGCENETTMRRR